MNLYKDALDILDKFSPEAVAEMSEWQLAYLCGLIKEYKPSKILEVGVAAGGTTAVLLNCISKLKYRTKFISLDISENYYRNGAYKTGFLIEKAKKYIGNYTEHELLIGITPEKIDKIGAGIDFLILDTVHMLPGELLDFLVCLPYLSDNAVVILHDVVLHHLALNGRYSFATQVLLDSVVGNKMPIFGVDNEFGYSNIAAFSINSDTKKYIYDVFSALLLSWQYLPGDNSLDLYQNKYTELNYPENCLKVFNCAREMNQVSAEKYTNNKVREILFMYNFISQYSGKNIYIYGAGMIGKKVYELLRYSSNIKGFIISDTEPAKEGVFHLSDVVKAVNDDIVLVSVNIGKQESIRREINKYDISNVCWLDSNTCDYLICMI